MLNVRNITKSFGAFTVRDVTFEVDQGEYFVLLGASGAGKTLILEMIAGLIRPDAGCIFLDGENITDEKIQNRRIGLVYQDQALFPHLTVYGNIAYGLRCRNEKGSTLSTRLTRLAEVVGITDLLDRYPSTLSGGEAQRVALARTLATEPRCLLLDEPISSLDVGPRAEMRALLRKINHQGQTIIHVTHDYEEAISLASRMAVIENGRIAQIDRPERLFQRPKSKFVARFAGIRNFFEGRLVRPPDVDGELAEFVTNQAKFSILTDAPNGPGYCFLRSEDVTVSNTCSETSALNTFPGRIVDIAPARLGVEVSVDIGVEISALITSNSMRKLRLNRGKEVWISFKASALQFIGE